MPFLRPIFEAGILPIITIGFKYTEQEAAIRGAVQHNGIDIAAPRGTKIFAPADGYYVCAYKEVMVIKYGQPHRISYMNALRTDPLATDINAPDPFEKLRIYRGGLVLQGWHNNGRYTQYWHLDWVNPRIPYVPPHEEYDALGQKTGNLLAPRVLLAPVAEYLKPGVAAFVRAGELIAVTGASGCGWGSRCYDFARFDPAGRPDFRGARYYHYTEPHLHFAVLSQIMPRSRQFRAYDPFGIYDVVTAGYPAHMRQWPERMPAAVHDPLWLPRS